MNEPRSVQAVEDWGVVLQSVPSQNKKAVAKRLVEIFELDKQDAEHILLNLPLILVDNLSFGLAARIKKFFLSIGASVETTNHDMIKKNCFQVLWPQTPDLSFFMKHEAGTAEASAQGKKAKAKFGGFSFFEKKDEKKEIDPEMKKNQKSPLPAKPLQEPAAIDPLTPPAPAIPIQEFPAPAPQSPLAPEASVPNPLPVFEEKPAAPSLSDADLDLKRRANELNEKLRKSHAEKQALHAQHAEAAEKVKSEYQQQPEEAKRKSDEIAKALEELHQKEAQKHEGLTREGEEWRSKAVALGEKVHELETNLTQKATEAEHAVRQLEEAKRKSDEIAKALEELHQKEAQKHEGLTREGEEWRSKAVALGEKVHELETNLTQKATEAEHAVRQLEEAKRKSDEIAKALEELHQKEAQKHEGLTREGEEWRSKAVALGEKVHELETNLTQKISEVEHGIREKEDLTQQSAKAAAETQQELSALRSREQEASSKIERLERSVQEMTESLRSRDDVLAQYEKQISKLAQAILPPSRETKPDTELSKPAGLFSKETVAGLEKGPSYADERSAKEKASHFSKSDLTLENTAKKLETDAPQEKIVYIIRGDRRSDMLWYKIPNTDAERKAAEKAYGRGLTMNEVMLKLTRKGWAISHRDENVITFTSREKSFGSVTFPLK